MVPETWIAFVFVYASHFEFTDSTLIQGEYTRISDGQTVTGKTDTDLTTQSETKCTLRCLRDVTCKAMRHSSGSQTCALIVRNSNQSEAQSFSNTDTEVVYKKNFCFDVGCFNGGTCVDGDDDLTCICLDHYKGRRCQRDCRANWCSPTPWVTGDQPAVYWSFDDDTGFTPSGGPTIVPGRVDSSLMTDLSQRQWVNLGIQSGACIPVPDSCGVHGATLAFWMRLNADCSTIEGILSSRAVGKSGFVVSCNSDLKYHIFVNNGDFEIDIDQISGWFHSVYNFIGPNEGEGTELFIDGILAGKESTRHGGSSSNGDGTLVVGRVYTDNDKWYGSFNMDELVFFDRTLSAEEVRLIYEMYD